MRINLGCGRTILPDHVNVDRVALPGVDVVADLGDPLPFPNGCAEELLLSHVLEHIANPLALMQELHRIAAPGGQLVVAVPYGSSDDAWEDPTHVRPYFLGSFAYFSQPYYWRADYGYRGDWRMQEIILVLDDRFKGGFWEPAEIMGLLRTERNVVSEMIAHLVAVKPIREPRAELHEKPKVTLLFR